MRAKAIAVAAAIAFVSAAGSASAAERFSTLGGTPAEPLTAAEMASIKGSEFFSIIITGPVNMITRRLDSISINHHIGVSVHPGQGTTHSGLNGQGNNNRGPGNNNGNN